MLNSWTNIDISLLKRSIQSCKKEVSQILSLKAVETFSPTATSSLAMFLVTTDARDNILPWFIKALLHATIFMVLHFKQIHFPVSCSSTVYIYATSFFFFLFPPDAWEVLVRKSSVKWNFQKENTCTLFSRIRVLRLWSFKVSMLYTHQSFHQIFLLFFFCMYLFACLSWMFIMSLKYVCVYC